MKSSLYNIVLVFVSIYYNIAFSKFVSGFVASCVHKSLIVKEKLKEQLNKNDLRNTFTKISNKLSFLKLNSILGEDVGLVGDLKLIIDNGSVPVNDREFRINGWRWHTKSVIRDLNRFLQILKKTSTIISTNNINNNIEKNELSKISSSYNFVYNFNWKGLIKVEKEIFFPWLENLLPNSASALINDIISQHKEIIGLSNKIELLCQSLQVNSNKKKIKDDLNEIELLTLKAKDCVLKIQRAQETIFIPFIKAYVTKQEQEVFNRRVISRLGLLNSQIHLVSMYEVVKDNSEELKLFEKQIPRIVQVTIPVWRKRFYLPMTKCLE